jgi:hypothetical protein
MADNIQWIKARRKYQSGWFLLEARILCAMQKEELKPSSQAFQ